MDTRIPRARRRYGRTRTVLAAVTSAAIGGTALLAIGPPASAATTSPCDDGSTPDPQSSVTCAVAGSYTLGVPAGTTSVDIDVIGAGGGAGYPARSHIGGNAAEITGTLTLPSGTAYLLVIAGAPGAGNNHGMGYGGGGSGIFALDDEHGLLAPLAAAGAGGGGAYNGDGGNAGSAGTSENIAFAAPGQPGVGPAGGAGGVGNYNAGAAGGDADPTSPTLASGGAGGVYPNGSAGGSGGGGYAGGGGGASGSQGILNVYAAGGGGGSSFASSYVSGAGIGIAPNTGGIQLPGLVAGDGTTGTVTLTFAGPAVPGAPTAVSADPGDGQAEVSFTAPTNDGGSAITSYTVTSDPDGKTATCPDSPCTVSGLENGTAYTFTVHATNENGDSAESTASAAVTPAVAPGAPAEVSAEPGDGQADVSFTAPKDDGGSAITSYTVTSDPDGKTATCPDSPCTVTGLDNGTAYTFTVHATNAIGGSPESSASAPVTPVGAPAAPGDVSAVPGDHEASVSFTAPTSDGGSAITSYTVTSDPDGKTATCDDSPCVVAGLKNGTAYTFTVHATNGAGSSEESDASAAVTPVAVPGAPTDVAAEAGDGQASVTFSAPEDDGGSAITSYTVTSDPDGKTATCDDSPCVVTGLHNGTAYTFTVHATNENGDSFESDASAAATPVGVPDAPTGVTATAGDGTATVSFSAPGNGGSAISGYTVTVSPGGTTTSCAASPCLVTGLLNGTAYTFTVHATNDHGDSAESPSSDAVTPTATPVPAPPTVGPSPGQGGTAWYHDPLTKKQRRSLAAVPAHPKSVSGPVRATRALYRTHDGTLAVPAGKVRGHQLVADQGVQLTNLFRFNSAQLTAQGRHRLVVLARSMKHVRAFTCEGYADYGGSASHEQALSGQRARAVCAVLTHQRPRMNDHAVGYGPVRPILIGGKAPQRTDNRRVDLLIRR